MKDLIDFIMNYSVLLGGTRVDIINLYWVLLLSTIVFVTRGISGYKVAKEEFKEKHFKSLKQYFTERSLFCIMTTTLISYIIVVLCGNQFNLGLNYIIIPFCGFLSTFYLNSYFKEKGWVLQKYPENVEKKDTDGKDSISVIINNSPSALLTTEKEEGMLREVTEEEIQKKGSAWFFNKLGRGYNELESRLDKNEEEMKQQSQILQALKMAQIEDRAIELEELIYSALTENYVTPETDKKIRNKYYIYHDILGGNHNIEDLFENKYNRLKIQNRETYN